MLKYLLNIENSVTYTFLGLLLPFRLRKENHTQVKGQKLFQVKKLLNIKEILELPILVCRLHC